MKITVATNGYLVEDNFGRLFIACTLQEAGRLIGEAFEYSPRDYTVYNQDSNANSLVEVHRLAETGERIRAIKTLRNCYSPKLGLREAMDIVDTMSGRNR